MEDTFWWRCEGGKWRDDDTCSNCGGLKPSIALKKIEEGSKITPTDKSYKMYIDHSTKVYFNHFSESQAVKLVELVETGVAKFEFPGHFYTPLMFSEYKDAINKCIDTLKQEGRLKAPEAEKAGGE
jgi:hypothetical protein